MDCGDFNEGWPERYRKLSVPEEMRSCMDCMSFNQVKMTKDLQESGENSSPTKVGFGLSEVKAISTLLKLA